MIRMSHILIIDDEESLRHTMGRVLRQAGFDVTTAGEGREALRLVYNGYESAAPFNVVYLDIRLPGMDGLQILKEIRQIDTQLPVILLTAYGSLKTAVEALRLGATDYLLKPLDPEVLVARTRVLLEEQAVDRRRHELRVQIAALQDELRSLEQRDMEAGHLSSGKPSTVHFPGARSEDGRTTSGTITGFNPEERFFKRGSLILDLQARRATFHDTVLALPPAAFDYLVVLARHAPEIIPYHTLVTEAQGYQADMREARELSKWHVHAIRQTLEADPANPQILLNVRGTGYRLVIDAV
jgi:DNA-binding response OmpR family regulator